MKILPFFAVPLLACLTTAPLAACAPSEYRKLAATCRNVKEGMTQAQVLTAMGSPESSDEPPARPGELWLRYYEGGDLAPIIIILTKSRDKYVVATASCRHGASWQ